MLNDNCLSVFISAVNAYVPVLIYRGDKVQQTSLISSLLLLITYEKHVVLSFVHLQSFHNTYLYGISDVDPDPDAFKDPYSTVQRFSHIFHTVNFYT